MLHVKNSRYFQRVQLTKTPEKMNVENPSPVDQVSETNLNEKSKSSDSGSVVNSVGSIKDCNIQKSPESNPKVFGDDSRGVSY